MSYAAIDHEHRMSIPFLLGGTSKEPEPAPSSTCLPADVIHELCRILRDEDQIETLSALRLTSKGFVPVVNEYVFRTVHLDRTVGSISRFIDLSRIPMGERVREIKLDAAMVLESVDYAQWSSVVKTFKEASRPTEDDLWWEEEDESSGEEDWWSEEEESWCWERKETWWGRRSYEAALARERDSAGSSKAVRSDQWRNYQAEFLEQQELNEYDKLRLSTALNQIFQQLSGVITLECRAYHSFKFALQPVRAGKERVH